MKKATNESVIIARHINAFLNEYVPSQKSHSSHTLRSYQYALALYIAFLETEKGISAESLCGECFNREIIEHWLQWLMERRDCSPETCNNRLASLRAFLKYLGSRDILLLYLSEEATRIPRKKEVRKKINGMSFAQKQRSVGNSVKVSASVSKPKAPNNSSGGNGYVYYKVRNGDSIWEIAKKYPGVSDADILRLNNMSKRAKIHPGQKLKIKPL